MGRKTQAFGGRRRDGFVSRISDDANAEDQEKLRAKSHELTNGSRVLTGIGIALIVLGVISTIAYESPIGIIGLSGLGVSLLILTAVVRPLDRILAQLVQINEKLDRDR